MTRKEIKKTAKHSLKMKIRMPLCIGLLLLFVTDSMYSSKYPNEGKGITDYVSTLSVTDLYHT